MKLMELLMEAKFLVHHWKLNASYPRIIVLSERLCRLEDLSPNLTLKASLTAKTEDTKEV